MQEHANGNRANAGKEPSPMTSNELPGVRAARTPLPVFLWIVSAFLIVDSINRGVDVTTDLMAGAEHTRQLLRAHFEDLMFATLNLLLFLQILLRTFAARIFGSLLFLLHIGFTTVTYAIRSPELWTLLEADGRVLICGRFIFCTYVLVLLNRDECKNALRS